MRSREALERLSEVAREQAGYVTVAQAKRRGIPGNDLVRMANASRLRRVLYGVYALPGGFPNPREDLIARWLRLQAARLPWEARPPEAFVSHASAASLYGIGTFVVAVPHFTVRHRRYQPSNESVRIYVALVEDADWQWLILPEAIRVSVTTVARTIIDLAYAGEERDHVLDALSEARDRRLVSDAELRTALRRRSKRGGRGSAGWLASYIANQ